MRIAKAIGFLVGLMLALAACSSTPDGDTAQQLLRSGSTLATEAKTGDFTIPVSGSYLGDASAETVNAKADRTTANSGTFVQKAFDFAGTIAAQNDAIKGAMDADPEVQAIKSELDASRAAGAPASEREPLIARLGEIRKAHLEAIGKAGGDLSNLKSIDVTNVALGVGVSGHDARPLTDAEASAASSAIPQIVRDSRGSQANDE